MLAIHEGQKILARTSGDRLLTRRAASGIVQGDDFPVVWICREEEWQEAKREDRMPTSIPWPATAVSPLPTDGPTEPPQPSAQSRPVAQG
jgi:hypothetical protein